MDITDSRPLTKGVGVEAERVTRGLFRLIRLTAGWALVVVGAILAPTPLPIGWALLLIGFSILVHDSQTVRNWVRRQRERNPRLGRWLDRNKRFAPGFAQRLLDLTEPLRKQTQRVGDAVRSRHDRSANRSDDRTP